MSNNFINQLYIGSVCESAVPTGIVSTGGYGNPNYDPYIPWDKLLSGGAFESDFAYCSLYESGAISGLFYSGYISSAYTGINYIREYSGYQEVFNSGASNVFSYNSTQSGFFTGIISFQNFTGLGEFNFSGRANFGATGEIYGFGQTGYLFTGGVNIAFTGDTWSALSGKVAGTISGVGSYFLRGSGGFGFSNLFLSSGQTHYSGYISGTGNRYTISGSGNELFSGKRTRTSSGFWTGQTLGYRSGFCVDSNIKRDDRLCGEFAPFRTNCEIPGTLDIRISYPESGQVFKIPYLSGTTDLNSLQFQDAGFPPLGTGVFPTGIYFTGILIYDTGDPNRPDDPDSDPDDDPNENIKCPFYDAVNPTCESGNNGTVSFILENSNPLECGIHPPYSGYVSKRFSLESEPEVIFTAAGTSEYPFPSVLTFNNVSESIYTLHLSGLSGYIEVIAPLSAQGGASSEVDIAVLNKTETCLSTDGVVRFQWSGKLDYSILGTSYVGTSTTGFLATGLQAGEYTAFFSENQWCESERVFTLKNQNAPVIRITTTGTTCTGSQAAGEALISVSGGAAPYSINWVYPNSWVGYTGLYANTLTVGDYAVQAIDASGCVSYEQFEIEQINNSLSATASAGTGSALVCCQHSTEEAVKLARISTTAFGGIPPYSYQWKAGGMDFSTGRIINAYPGEYYCEVTDANGCSALTNTITVKATNHCYKVKWSSELVNGDLYQEYIYVAKPGEIPTTVPFKYSVPGEYRIKLSIADGYGRVGINCINIFIKGYTPILIEPPDFDDDKDGVPDDIDPDDDNDGTPDSGDEDDDGDGTPDEDDPDLGGDDNNDGDPDDPNDPPLPPGGGGGDEDDGDGDGDDGDDPNQRNVCCVLLNSGTNDTTCRTHCTVDSSFCKDKDQNNHKSVACLNNGDNCCESCNAQWTPQKGACCICQVVEGEEPYEECICQEISSCDPSAACKKIAIAAGDGFYTHGFASGKNCNESSPDYACPIGICCQDEVPEGQLGEGCGPICVGRLTESECKKKWGTIISRTELTCEAAGATQWHGAWYCSFNPALCCIKGSPSDSSSSCPCQCEENMTCKSCEELIELMQTASPQCNYAGSYSPRSPETPVDQLPDCGDEDTCGCEGSSSAGVGGPT
jgi:hypothetical protein